MVIREKSMIRWIRVTNVLETVFLIITHIFSFSTNGSYGLGAFYILNSINASGFDVGSFFELLFAHFI